MPFKTIVLLPLDTTILGNRKPSCYYQLKEKASLYFPLPNHLRPDKPSLYPGNYHHAKHRRHQHPSSSALPCWRNGPRLPELLRPHGSVKLMYTKAEIWLVVQEILHDQMDDKKIDFRLAVTRESGLVVVDVFWNHTRNGPNAAVHVQRDDHLGGSKTATCCTSSMDGTFCGAVCTCSW